MQVVRQTGERLERGEQRRGRGAEQRSGLAGDDGAVGQLDGRRRSAGFLGTLERRRCDRTVGGGNARLIHQQLELAHAALVAETHADIAERLIVAADDLLAGGLAAGLVVNDAVARHVDAHIGRGVIGTFAGDLLEDGGNDREDLDVAVVVDRGDAVGLEVERVDHVDVVEVGGRRLVGEVDRMLERQVPDGEGFELRVACGDAALVLMVELAEAGRHLARAGAGGGDDNERAGGFDVFVAAVALVRYDERHVARITRDGVVHINRHAERSQTLFEGVRSRLTGVLRDNDRADVQTDAAEGVDEAEHIHIIGDAEVGADLVLLNVACRDNDDDFCVVLHLAQHANLAVGREAGQHAARVVVVEQLAAELKVQLAAEMRDALLDVRRLGRNVFVVVKSDFLHIPVMPP